MPAFCLEPCRCAKQANRCFLLEEERRLCLGCLHEGAIITHRWNSQQGSQFIRDACWQSALICLYFVAFPFSSFSGYLQLFVALAQAVCSSFEAGGTSFQNQGRLGLSLVRGTLSPRLTDSTEGSALIAQIAPILRLVASSLPVLKRDVNS